MTEEKNSYLKKKKLEKIRQWMKLAKLNLEYLDNRVSSIIQVPYGSCSTLFHMVPPLTLSTFPMQLEGPTYEDSHPLCNFLVCVHLRSKVDFLWTFIHCATSMDAFS
jgi:hypothetical protein